MTPKIKLVETFDNLYAVSLQENTATSQKKSRVDGKYIIGMVEGEFFKPDGMSRNQRWYPRTLWEKALNSADVKNRFLTSTMFGEIGHSDGPVEDLTLRTGCASHFIDELWITSDGRGMGRAYILNTPTGNLLKTYLGAGCKLKVSTRGEGTYKEGCYHEGYPVIDDDTYELQTVDFVLNPGFLETNATLKEAYNHIQQDIQSTKKEINETIKHITKEGEHQMTLDFDAYVQELKDEKKALKAEIESLKEELKAKDKELLQKQFNESAEVKKLKEAYAPFKKMNVSAKTLNEAIKRSQEIVKKTKAANQKLTEELQAYKTKCGSLKEIDEATRLSSKSLRIIEEYRKFGAPEEIKELVENASKAVAQLRDYKELAENAEKLLKHTKNNKALEEAAQQATKVIGQYRKLVGSLHEAKKLVTKKVQPVAKKPNVSEAVTFSRKHNCTVESAARLINKYGASKAAKLVESINKRVAKPQAKLASSKKLVEEVAQLDKVNDVPEPKSAKDFVTPGLIKNYFNDQALGKQFGPVDLNTIDGTKPKRNAAAELLSKCKEFEVAEGPKNLDKLITPAEAEAEIKKLLK